MAEDASSLELELVTFACSLVKLRGRNCLTDWQVERFLELSQSTNIDIETAKELAFKIESTIENNSTDEDAVFMSPSLSQAGCRNSNVSVGIDLAKLKVSPSVVSIAVGDTISFRNVARGSALSSIGVFLKMHQLSDPGNLDSDRAMVWEVDFLPPGDPLEWRATSTGEYHFESESYPFLRGYITVREPPALPFRQQLIADITTVQPKSQQGEPLVKPQGSPAVGYGALKATEVTSTAAEGSGDVSVCARPDVGASELTIDDIPYEPLKGGPDLAESTGRLLKQFEEIEEHSFRPATKWAPPPRKMQPMAMNLVEVDIDSHAVIGNKVFHSFESLPGPSRHPSEADSHSLRMLSEDDNPPSASSSHGRSAPKLKCSCGKEFSSSLNLKRCQTLHLVHEQSEGVGVGERGGARKAKGGSKKKEAEQSALHSQRLLDLKDFWKQTMHIDQRAKVLSLEGSEQHRKMSSSILLGFEKRAQPRNSSPHAASGRLLFDLVKGAKDICSHSDPIQRADELDWGNPEWDELRKILHDTSDGLCFSDPGARHEIEMTKEGCAEAAIGLMVEQALFSSFNLTREQKKEEEERDRLKKMEEAEKDILAMVEKEEKEKREKKEKEAEKKAKAKAKAVELDRKKEDERRIKEEEEASAREKAAAAALVTLASETPVPPQPQPPPQQDISQPFVEPVPARSPSAPRLSSSLSSGSISRQQDQNFHSSSSKPVSRVPSANIGQSSSKPPPKTAGKTSKPVLPLAPMPPLPARPSVKPTTDQRSQNNNSKGTCQVLPASKTIHSSQAPASAAQSKKTDQKADQKIEQGYHEPHPKDDAPSKNPQSSSSADVPPPVSTPSCTPLPTQTDSPVLANDSTQGASCQHLTHNETSRDLSPPTELAPEPRKEDQDQSASFPPPPGPPQYQAPSASSGFQHPYPQPTGFMPPLPHMMGYGPFMHPQPMMSYPVYPPGPYYPSDQGPMMQHPVAVPVPMEWMQQPHVYAGYGMPGPYMMMMPSPGMMQAPYMAPPPGWMPAPPIMYVEEGNQAQGQPGPPPASSPPPEVIAPPHGNPTTPSRDSAVAGYAKEKMSNNNSDVGVVREQETHEQQQARKEGFANLLSKALPTTSAPSEPKPEATKAGKAPASRSFNVVAAEEDSKARWNEIQAKMNSKKPK